MKIVIFCGGHGTRLWPISRKSFPKPFVKIIKGKSFLQITYDRFRKAFAPEDIFISTEDRYLSFVKNQLPELPRKNIICEPERKDTLGAIGLVATVINKYHPGEVIFISWAKHFFAKESIFMNAVVAAGEYATKTGKIVSIDSKPEFASVHNGWVQMGDKVGEVDGCVIREQIKHVEKPEKIVAEKLFKDRDWLIHLGNKAIKTDVLLELLNIYQPDVYQGLVRIADSWGSVKQNRVLEDEYNKFPSVSIDYGLYEKIPQGEGRRLVIPIDAGWEDAFISWQTFYKALITPKNKMVVEGGVDTQFIDSENNLVIGNKGKMISVIGVSNIAVVDSPDGLLVCDLSMTQKVKDLYAKLERYYPEYTE